MSRNYQGYTPYSFPQKWITHHFQQLSCAGQRPLEVLREHENKLLKAGVIKSTQSE